ncbi:MAG: response regulator transcription factor [Myxococcales bacterium]|jgi:two-component system KDP operon response regulator KdpE
MRKADGDGYADAWSLDVKRALLLVVEDDPEMRGVLTLALQGEGFDVKEAVTGGEALRLIHTRAPDAAILDLGLPDIDGLELITKIRSEHELPIIVLSARTDEEAQIRALDGGANDFVTKPFRERELLARVRVALRKPLPFASATGSITLGDLRIESASRRVFLSEAEVKLTRTEFELLDALARKADHVVTHNQLLRAVWGADHVHEIHYLRVYVKLLRQKIEVEPTKPRRLLTALGVGYRLVAAPR